MQLPTVGFEPLSSHTAVRHVTARPVFYTVISRSCSTSNETAALRRFICANTKFRNELVRGGIRLNPEVNWECFSCCWYIRHKYVRHVPSLLLHPAIKVWHSGHGHCCIIIHQVWNSCMTFRRNIEIEKIASCTLSAGTKAFTHMQPFPEQLYYWTRSSGS